MKLTRINRIVIFIMAFCTQFFSSCQKEISYTRSEQPVNQVDVYIAGTEYNGIKSIAKYWKNDSAVNLTDGTKNAEARSIFVSGNDVYIAGWENNGTYNAAVYWKNGKPVYLSDGTKDELGWAITVSGNDVYVAGDERSYTCNAPGGIGFIATYWKNGIKVNVSDGNYDAYARAIAVNGNNVYVAGSEYNTTGYFGTYWKNSDPVRLSDFFTGVVASSIAVSGNDVFVVGTEYFSYSNNKSAKYWKNGKDMHLTDNLMSYAECVFVSDKNDVYVCGNEDDNAVYWKNGAKVILEPNSTALSIATSGNDVFTAGVGSNGTHAVAKYWKNGKSINLSDGSKDERAYSIFLSPH